ncbi:hypothetical protein WJ972_29660 [Achromobacter insuavis]
MVLLQDSYHMICVDHERERVMQNVLSFLGKDPGIVRVRRRDNAPRAARGQEAQSGAEGFLVAAR